MEYKVNIIAHVDTWQTTVTNIDMCLALSTMLGEFQFTRI